jgi:hypothetical protein
MHTLLPYFKALFKAKNASEARDALELSWLHYLSQWSVAPVSIGAATSPVTGTVFEHTNGTVTVYRLVPDPYDPEEDAFYSSHTAGVLTGKLASRG